MQEKRFATVLFADISGFTTLTASIGAEQTTEFINECFNTIDMIIHNYHGTVIRHEGDRVLAVFGFPRSYGNDSKNALLCSLKIRDAIKNMRYNIDIHIGVGTGEVLVSQEYVYGHLVDEVSRLEEIAEKGQILVNEETYRINQNIFLFERMKNGFALKGFNFTKQEPDFFYECRNDEHQKLKEIILKFPRFIIVSGEKGIGKSFFIAETLRKINAENIFDIQEVTFTELEHLTFGSPFIKIVRQMAPDFNLSLSEDQYRKWLLREMASVILQTAKAKPLIFFLKNIELADDFSIQFLEHLSQFDTQKKMMIIIETENLNNRVVKRLVSNIKTDFEHIDLKPLTPEIMQGIITEFLKDYILTESFKQEICNLCHGNIFYAFEISSLIKNFYAPGTELKEFPDSRRLKEITEALIDTIPEDVRKGLYILSLIDNPEDELCKRLIPDFDKFFNYCQERNLLRFQNSKIHFSSELLKNSIRDRLTKKSRQQYHLTIAQALKESSNQIENYYTIGFHLKEAGEYQEAYEFYMRFASQLERDFYYDGCITVCDEILSFLRGDEHEKRCEVLHKKIKLLHLMAEREKELEAINEFLQSSFAHTEWYRVARISQAEYFESTAEYDKALKILKELNSEREDAQLLEKMGLIYFYKDEIAEALKILNRAWDCVKDSTDYSLTGNILKDIGLCYWKIGDKDRALLYYTKAKTFYERAENRIALCRLSVNIGNVYYYLNRFDQAMTYYSEAFNMAQKINDSLLIAQILSNMGGIYVQFGEYEEALKKFKEALEIDRKKLNRKGEAIRLSNIGNILGMLGETEEALSYFKSALRIDEAINNKSGIAIRYGNIATCLMQKGEYAEAVDYLSKAVEISEKIGSIEYLAYYKNLLGSAYLRLNELDRAATCFNEALSFARRAKNQSYEIIIQSNLASLFLKKGDINKAYQYSIWAVEKLLGIQEIEGDKEIVYYTHYKILSEMQKSREAYQFLKSAYEIIVARAQKIKNTDFKKKFMSLPQNQEIIETWKTNERKE
ncbi:MAG: tetratricopeptide repeat protein [candidate division WOR-3 bacterium]|nr:tetratricopeptide repeat protein [candidate division WOR-3 bacterium]